MMVYGMRFWGQMALASYPNSAVCQLGPELNLPDPVSSSIKEG